jgi:hypothetical protein
VGNYWPRDLGNYLNVMDKFIENEFIMLEQDKFILFSYPKILCSSSDRRHDMICVCVCIYIYAWLRLITYSKQSSAEAVCRV